MNKEENLYFTEITENEKRIINLIRTYIAPLGTVDEFVEFIVEHTANQMLDKTIKLQAFLEVMQKEKNQKSNIQIMALMNQFEKYIASDQGRVQNYLGAIYGDFVTNLEGDIKPIEVYNLQDKVNEEEKMLDKIQEI